MTDLILEYWVVVAMGGLLYFIKKYFNHFDKKIDKFITENKSMKLGIQAVLRDRIIQSHRYLTDKGFASIEERDSIYNMYDQYHTLGVNGVIDCLIDEIGELPIRLKREGGSSDSTE